MIKVARAIRKILQLIDIDCDNNTDDVFKLNSCSISFFNEGFPVFIEGIPNILNNENNVDSYNLIIKKGNKTLSSFLDIIDYDNTKKEFFNSFLVSSLYVLKNKENDSLILLTTGRLRRNKNIKLYLNLKLNKDRLFMDIIKKFNRNVLIELDNDVFNELQDSLKESINKMNAIEPRSIYKGSYLIVYMYNLICIDKYDKQLKINNKELCTSRFRVNIHYNDHPKCKDLDEDYFSFIMKENLVIINKENKDFIDMIRLDGTI